MQLQLHRYEGVVQGVLMRRYEKLHDQAHAHARTRAHTHAHAHTHTHTRTRPPTPHTSGTSASWQMSCCKGRAGRRISRRRWCTAQTRARWRDCSTGARDTQTHARTCLLTRTHAHPITSHQSGTHAHTHTQARRHRRPVQRVHRQEPQVCAHARGAAARGAWERVGGRARCAGQPHVSGGAGGWGAGAAGACSCVCWCVYVCVLQQRDGEAAGTVGRAHYIARGACTCLALFNWHARLATHRSGRSVSCSRRSSSERAHPARINPHSFRAWTSCSQGVFRRVFLLSCRQPAFTTLIRIPYVQLSKAL
jgi:hypothetical protein